MYAESYRKECDRNKKKYRCVYLLEEMGGAFRWVGFKVKIVCYINGEVQLLFNTRSEK